jgi:hypothetical protein
MKLTFFILCLAINNMMNLKLNKSLAEFNKTLKLEETNSNKDIINSNNIINQTQQTFPIPTSNQNSDCNCQPILQGWLKYLEINESGQIPSYFEKNDKMFNLQRTENQTINTTAKDSIGYINIPCEDFFLFKLCKNELQIYTARNERYKQLRKSLNLNYLIPQEANMQCKGGVEEVGDFSEGFCFMLKFRVNGKPYIWELCAETLLEKQIWMNNLLQLTNPNNNNNSMVNIPNASTSTQQGILGFTARPINITQPVINNVAFPNPLMVPPPLGVMPGTVVAVSRIRQVQMIPIGDWSPCSKPCGRGTQTRPVKCPDETICKGTHVEERECNIQACKEEIDQSLEKLQRISEGQWELLGSWSPCSRECGGGIQSIERRCPDNKCIGNRFLVQDCNIFNCANDPNSPVVTASELFNREKYDECKLLEGNLVMIVNNQKQLSHIEVNRQTIQIFSQNNPTAPIIVPLARILDIHPSTTNCFDLVDQFGNRTMLCTQSHEGI